MSKRSANKTSKTRKNDKRCYFDVRRNGLELSDADAISRTVSNTNNNGRSQQADETSQEKPIRGAKTGPNFGVWLETAASVDRVVNGLPPGLDPDPRRSGTEKRIKQIVKRLEQLRKARVKQMGNALVPQIAQFLGEKILEGEK